MGIANQTAELPFCAPRFTPQITPERVGIAILVLSALKRPMRGKKGLSVPLGTPANLKRPNAEVEWADTPDSMPGPAPLPDPGSKGDTRVTKKIKVFSGSAAVHASEFYPPAFQQALPFGGEPEPGDENILCQPLSNGAPVYKFVNTKAAALFNHVEVGIYSAF